jgi:RNA polymerase sigma-70 factor (ECF subfamily)
MWPDAQETQELLAAARSGKGEAVTELLTKHRDALRRAISARLDPALARRVDASDIVQDVLFEASRRLDQYLQDPRMPFHLWLRQLAQDHMIDAHRRHRKAQRRSLDREQPLRLDGTGDQSSMDLAAQFVDPELTPSAAAIRQEMQRRFTATLALLNDEDREIIVLRHVEQLPNQDVAALLQLSEAAASMRYLRAVRRLRAMLANNTEESQNS